MNPLRPVILAAADSDRIKRTLLGFPVTADIVARFVAGETRAELLVAVRELLSTGRSVSVDFLGENTTQPAQADKTLAEYIALINDLAAQRNSSDDEPSVSMPLEVSVKLSALGQALPGQGQAMATENLRTLCTKAEQVGVWVTVDAEDHTTIDATMATTRQIRPEFPWLGSVVQAYLRRSESDCRDLAAAGARVRLCKGAYREPESVAFRHVDEVDSSYLRCLAVLMRGPGYPMVASHDPQMIGAAARLAASTGRRSGDLEYQMLYGIRDDEQRTLSAAGYRVRVYVPYGDQWYGYLLRRIAERPANLRFFLRSLVQR